MPDKYPVALFRTVALLRTF